MNWWTATLFLQIVMFAFFKISVPNIFENISKPVGFLGKINKIYFVAKFSSYQENFEFLKSVAYYY